MLFLKGKELGVHLKWHGVVIRMKIWLVAFAIPVLCDYGGFEAGRIKRPSENTDKQFLLFDYLSFDRLLKNGLLYNNIACINNH